MVREYEAGDSEAVRAVINDAALAYRGVIPPGLYREPWAPEQHLAGAVSRRDVPLLRGRG